MFMQRYGNGRRAFLGLHGWSGDHRSFAPLLPFLPADAILYSCDLPGYGHSPAPDAWTLEALVEELARAIVQLPVEKLTLLGNCSGALLGLAVAARLPARFERFVLLDPFAFVPWYFRLFLDYPFGKYAYYSAFANPLGRWITNRSLAKHRQSETDLTSSFRRVDHAVSLHYLRVLASIGSIQRFQSLCIPTDIVYGARSFQAIKQSVQQWQALWPHAQVCELAAAGHLPLLEATEALSRIVFKAED